MVVAVGVLFRIIVEKAERFPQPEDVFRLPGQKGPAGAVRVMRFRELFQLFRRVFFRAQRD